ncbi:polymorphic toxin type 50 domain-containing protein [Anaeropeptidivorans aminofermentans]|uniref:polymorphic toxin type 50 domain-containing protein n=1 Tax=Anaeropeptidivorans aminofermentans TaxID=2934315 RepID=UPI00202578FF|nr:polymorphic toxin type 50 domain-containing protein [Anaeropeptidivorans aminofermentans]
MEGLSSVTNYFAAKSSNAFNALQKMEEVDKYFKEEFLQGAQYSKEIKEFYVSNNKALEGANAIGIRDGKGPEGTGSKANPNGIKVNKGQQDKHIPGTNNYNQEVAKGKPRSILSENPQQLLDDYAGTGQLVGATKERIDFGKMIGQYYDEATGTYTDTTKGIIHYDSKGQAHIVPARP